VASPATPHQPGPGPEARRGHPSSRWPMALKLSGCPGWMGKPALTLAAGWWRLRRLAPYNPGRRVAGCAAPPLEAGGRFLRPRPCCSRCWPARPAGSGSGCCAALGATLCCAFVLLAEHGGCSTKPAPMGCANTRTTHTLAPFAPGLMWNMHFHSEHTVRLRSPSMPCPRTPLDRADLGAQRPGYLGGGTDVPGRFVQHLALPTA